MVLKKILLGILFLPLINANVVIDVRTSDEWSSGHLENAMNIEWQDILNITSSVTKDEKVYLYCRSGNRSGRAAQILIDAGYSNVTNAGSLEHASNLLNLKVVK